MTTIIGIQGKGWGLIAADSLIVGGDQKFIASGMDKVVEKGEYVIAFAGDAIAGDIALHSWNAPKIPRGVNLDKFMMTDLLPSLKQAYADYGYDPSPKSADNDPKDGSGRFLAVFDPLDGSSNIDVNVSVGSIFSVLRAPQGRAPTTEDFLLPGLQQLAAGYAIYGPSTMFVMTVGKGTHGFTLDREVGNFILTHPNM